MQLLDELFEALGLESAASAVGAVVPRRHTIWAQAVPYEDLGRLAPGFRDGSRPVRRPAHRQRYCCELCNHRAEERGRAPVGGQCLCVAEHEGCVAERTAGFAGRAHHRLSGPDGLEGQHRRSKGNEMLLTFQPGQVHTADRRAGVTRWTRRWGRSQAAVAVEPAVARFTLAERRPGTDGFARWATQLGERVDECGLAATADGLNKLVNTARELRVAPVATNVLADRTQPEPARLRAFASVVSALVAMPAPRPT